MRTDYTRMAYETFNELINMEVAGLTDEDIEKQLYELPYPEEYYEYFKRVIYNMPEFKEMDYVTMWEDSSVYKKLGAMHYESLGRGKKQDYAERWKKILTGEMKESVRKSIFMCAVVIHMPPEEFLKALSRLDGFVVNVHSPEEFLLYYCIQANDETYTLAHYEKLLGSYEDRRKEYDASTDKRGMEQGTPQGDSEYYTIMAESFLNDEVWGELSNEERDEKMIMFLVKNGDEMTDSIAITDKKNRYSLTYASRIYRMLSYIFVLYGYGDNKKKCDALSLTYLDTNRTVNWYAGILNMIVETIFEAHYHKTNKKSSPGRVFEHLYGIGSHMEKVEGQLKPNPPKSAAPVKREDVLFISLLLICGFLDRIGKATVAITSNNIPKKFNETLGGNEAKEIDEMIDNWQKDKRFTDWICEPERHTVFDRYVNAKEYLNQCLEAFNLFHIYEPNPMDRLVLLCLMSEEPLEALTEVYKRWMKKR